MHLKITKYGPDRPKRMDGNTWKTRGTVLAILMIAVIAAGCIGADGSVDGDTTRDEAVDFGTATTLWMEQGYIIEDADLSHWHYSQQHATPPEHQANLTEAREQINQIEEAILDHGFTVDHVDALMLESIERAHRVLDGILSCGDDYDCPEREDPMEDFYLTFDAITDGIHEEMNPPSDPRPGNR